MMTFVRRIALVAVPALSATLVAAQGAPPLPHDLVNVAAVACVRLDDSGAVSGAFLIRSTGEHGKDQELVAWIRQLRWPPMRPGEKPRNTWSPMPIAVGSAEPPAAPARCAPSPVEADITSL
jgi:hypothetical protein